MVVVVMVCAGVAGVRSRRLAVATPPNKPERKRRSACRVSEGAHSDEHERKKKKTKKTKKRSPAAAMHINLRVRVLTPT
jgi:hypothetical protein